MAEDVWDGYNRDSRFAAPPRRQQPECVVRTCSRDAYSVVEGTMNLMLCAEHTARFYLVSLLFVGDEDAIGKWKEYTTTIGDEVGWGSEVNPESGVQYGVLGVGVGALPATTVSRPYEWRCAVCGGGMMSGPPLTFTHRCEPERKGGPLDAG